MTIDEYLLENMSDTFKKRVKSGKFIHECECFLQDIKEMFSIDIPCKLYNDAISGQGREKDKIQSIHSSALQALLVFGQVSDKNPLKIKKVEYTKVEFEVENTVAGYPSSIDVVLSNENKEVLYIESKLNEILQESNEEGNCEVGPTYFSNHISGYSKSLGLDLENLNDIGIKLPSDIINYGETNKSKVKEIFLANKNLLGENINANGWYRIQKLDENKYVYSYGIKQFLSHIIGILNAKAQSGYKYKSVQFVEIINELPDFQESETQIKLSNYEVHLKKVKDILEKNSEKKELGIKILDTMTYQDLYEENKEYFEDMREIAKFYHLAEFVKES